MMNSFAKTADLVTLALDAVATAVGLRLGLWREGQSGHCRFINCSGYAPIFSRHYIVRGIENQSPGQVCFTSQLSHSLFPNKQTKRVLLLIIRVFQLPQILTFIQFRVFDLESKNLGPC
jgi:hypothetical protein